MSRTIEKLLFLDSKNARVNDSGDFDFQINEMVTNCMTIQLTNCSIPWSWPTISNYTNTLNFNDGTEHSLTLQQGNYDTSSIIIALKTLLESPNTGLVVTVSFSDVTNKLSILSNKQLIIHGSSSSCMDIIGISSSDVTFVTNVIKEFEYPLNLLITDHIELRLPKMVNSLEGRTYIEGSNNDIVEPIFLSGFVPWDLVNLSSQTTLILNVEKHSFNNIVIRLVDAQGYTPDALYDHTRFPFLISFKLICAI